MRRMLEERSEGYIAPASELEARFLALIRSAGLPEPVRQHNVGDERRWLGRSDYAYPDLLLRPSPPWGRRTADRSRSISTTSWPRWTWIDCFSWNTSGVRTTRASTSSTTPPT